MYADARWNARGGRIAIRSPKTENTAKNENTLLRITPTACTAANLKKNKNSVCDAVTTVGNRMHDAAFTSSETRPTRNSTATRFAENIVRVEIGSGTRLM